VPAEKRREIFDRYVYESGRAIREIAFWVLDPRGASKVDARKVACPVLAVAGAKDNITPPSMVRAVARKYRSVSMYKEFEDHGHWVLDEPGWERIAQFIADRLDGGSAGSASHS
jgi:pimeloyl-ACP methyl ester carboxylesterase